VRPSLLIADGHRLYAEALCSMLSESYEIVGIATDGLELTELAIRHTPDLIVTELSMPRLSGLGAMHDLKKKGLRTKFLVLTTHTEVGIAALAFCVGASAFVLKTASSDELTEAISAMKCGGHYLSRQFPGDLDAVLAKAARRPLFDQGPHLSRHEREILRFVQQV